MQFRTFIFTLAASVLWALPATATPLSDEAIILQLERDIAGSNTTAAATAAWDPDVVLDDRLTAQPKIAQYVGLEAARKGWDPQFAAYTYSVETLRIKVKSDGKLGFAWSTLRAKAVGKSGEPPIDVVFRQATLYEKKAGQWKVVYINLSVPFDGATGKAVFDGR